MNLKNKTQNHILKLSKSMPNLTFKSSIFKQVGAGISCHSLPLEESLSSRTELRVCFGESPCVLPGSIFNWSCHLGERMAILQSIPGVSSLRTRTFRGGGNDTKSLLQLLFACRSQLRGQHLNT